MKKRKIYFALFITAAILTLTYLGGCDKSFTSEPEKNKEYGLKKATKIEEHISIDDKTLKDILENEVNELLSIRENITLKVLENKPDFAELRDAYSESDEIKIARLMNLTKEEIHSMDVKLKEIIKRIKGKVPEFAIWIENKKNDFCAKCKTETFFNNFYSYITTHRRLTKTSDQYLGSDCQWAPYLVSLGLCTGLGPLLYWPCAYAVMCRFCWGPEVDALCGKRGG